MFDNTDNTIASYGLLNSNQELVFACTVSHLKANKYEISSYAQKCGVHVKGGIDRFLDAVIEEFDASYVKCKFDRRWFNIRTLDDCFKFTGHHYTKSEFYYTQYVSEVRLFPKDVTDEFITQLKKYDNQRSFDQNLDGNYFAKIYDSGKLVMTWKK